MRLEPAESIAAVGFLHSLLPAESRERPIDPSGVMGMHRALVALRGERYVRRRGRDESRP